VDPESVGQVADALKRIATDPALASSLVSKGLARAAELGWESFAQVHVDVYREVLFGAAGAPTA